MRKCGTWAGRGANGGGVAGRGPQGRGESAGPPQGAGRFFLAHPEKAGLYWSFLKRGYIGQIANWSIRGKT
jgi:hypothetical protein